MKERIVPDGSIANELCVMTLHVQGILLVICVWRVTVSPSTGHRLQALEGF